MKKILKTIGVALSTIAASAQMVVTNPATLRLLWDNDTNAVSWQVSVFRPPATNAFASINATTNLLSLSNIVTRTGNYRFEVRGLDSLGLAGPTGSGATNLHFVPIVLNLRVEMAQ